MLDRRLRCHHHTRPFTLPVCDFSLLSSTQVRLLPVFLCMQGIQPGVCRECSAQLDRHLPPTLCGDPVPRASQRQLPSLLLRFVLVWVAFVSMLEAVIMWLWAVGGCRGWSER